MNTATLDGLMAPGIRMLRCSVLPCARFEFTDESAARAAAGRATEARSDLGTMAVAVSIGVYADFLHVVAPAWWVHVPLTLDEAEHARLVETLSDRDAPGGGVARTQAAHRLASLDLEQLREILADGSYQSRGHGFRP